MFVEPSAPYGPPLPPRPAPAQPPMVQVGGAGKIPVSSLLSMRETHYFHPAPAARLWVDEERIVVDLDHLLQRTWHVDPIDQRRDTVLLLRLVHRRLSTALTVVLVDQSEPRLYFAVSNPDELRTALDQRGWRVEEQRSKLRPWAPLR